MLYKFALQNFKSIGEPGVELELKPLTILLGPNGSGKSNILEGLAFFAQSAIANARRKGGLVGGLDFKGEFLNYPYEEEIFHKHNPQEWLATEVHTKLTGKEKEFAKLVEKVNRASLGVPAGMDGFGYRYSIRKHPIFGLKAEQSIFSDGQLVITAGWEHDEEKKTALPRFKHPPILRKTRAGDEIEHFLYPYTFNQTDNIVEGAKPLNELAKLIVDLISSKLMSPEKKSKMFLISGLRGEIKPEELTGKWPEWVGKHGENLAYILSRLQSPENEEKKKKANKWAARFKADKPWAGLVDVNTIGSSFIDVELKISPKLALASYGSRQILSVIIQLFWSEPGDIIMIEEPEISLHPESQAELPELFADAISEGKQIIVTTHSYFFPYALRKTVESEEHHLNVKDIAIYHVERDEKGCTKAVPLKLDESGYIQGESGDIEEWIPSFSKVGRELSERWFKTLGEEEEE